MTQTAAEKANDVLKNYPFLRNVYTEEWLKGQAELRGGRIWRAHPMVLMALDPRAHGGLEWREDCLRVLDSAGIRPSPKRLQARGSRLLSSWSEVRVAAWLIKAGAAITAFDQAHHGDIELVLHGEQGRVSIKTPYDGVGEERLDELIFAVDAAFREQSSPYHCSKGARYRIHIPQGSLRGIPPRQLDIDQIVQSVGKFALEADMSREQSHPVSLKSGARDLSLQFFFEPADTPCPMWSAGPGESWGGSAEERFKDYVGERLAKHGWGEQLCGAVGARILVVDATTGASAWQSFLHDQADPSFDVFDLHPPANSYIDFLGVYCFFHGTSDMRSLHGKVWYCKALASEQPKIIRILNLQEEGISAHSCKKHSPKPSVRSPWGG